MPKAITADWPTSGRLLMTNARVPLNLSQIDQNSCSSNRFAVLRWMFGTCDLQGAEAIHEIDRLIDRTPGEHASLQSIQRGWALLLSDGLELIQFDAWDERAIRKHRLAALADYFSWHWTDELEAYWTDERLDQYILDRVDSREYWLNLAGPHLHRFHKVPRRPTLADLRNLLGTHAIMTDIEINGVEHAVLVVGYDDSGFAVYDPYVGRQENLLYYPEQFLEGAWLDGMTVAVGRPSKVR